MITKILMPKFNMSMTFGLVSRWFKHEGDLVVKGEPLCEIEGDKATMELESPADGILLKILVPEGKEGPILKSIGFIGKPGDNYQVELEKEAADTAESEPSPAAAPVTPPLAPQSTDQKRVHASPVAKRLALELGVDLATITGTGEGGLIGREDVLKAKEQQTTGKSGESDGPSVKRTISVSGIKKVTAERMKESYLNAPHFGLTISVNMKAATAFRENLKGDVHVTFTDILIYAVSRSLSKNDLLNSTLKGDEIQVFDDINIGVAAATDKGLIVPVVKNADKLAIEAIALKRKELADAAKEGKITADKLSGGTFTITNLGMYDVESFNPIIFPGQACILGVGSINSTPVVDETGHLVAEPIMKMTLVSDHRIVDGVDAGNFLKDLKTLIEDINNN